MKTMKFFSYAVFVLFLGIAISSCKGDDGADGATGPAGPAGQNGTDGVDGTDGNANVQTYVYNNPTWNNGSFMEISMSGILTADVIENDAVLGYVNFGNDTYIMPGIVWSGVSKQFKIFLNSDNELFTIASHELDGSYTATANLFEVSFVKIIIIESTNTTTTTGNGRVVSPQQAIYNELDEAGVDVNDYYAVCAYYGINPE